MIMIIIIIIIKIESIIMMMNGYSETKDIENGDKLIKILNNINAKQNNTTTHTHTHSHTHTHT